MSISKAMRDRHTVRRYTTEPMLESTATQLNERVQRLNEEHATNIRLVRDDSSCLNLLAKLFMSKNVRNYLVMAGTDGPGIEERLGWCGADLMLFAQELGLNSWFVGGTYSPKRAARAAGVNGKIVGVIALGYGTTQGVPHKSKAASEVSSYAGTAPAWFTEGVEAALLAPTAMNRQAFHIDGAGDKVSLKYDNGPCSNVDRGIVTYHFEAGAGRENFSWDN